MTANYDAKLLFLVLATCATFILLEYFSPLVGLVLMTLVLSMYRPRTNYPPSEAFQDATASTQNNDEYWNVRFQNKVMFYNSPCFLRSNSKQNMVGTNCSVSDLQRLPTSFSWENFVIDDARMGYGAYRGNVNQLQYGKPFHLQSQSRNSEIQLYVTLLDNKLQVTDKRDYNTQFQLLPVAGNNKMYVQFGDTVYLQHKSTGNFIAVDKYTNDSIKLTKEQNKNSEWRILNQLAYGKGIDVDWARESWATQSSLYQGSKFPASNCTDGDPNTYCHSDEDKDIKEPYFELHLPRLIDIQKVRILNRQDAGKERLGKFYITIYLDLIDPQQQKLVSTEVFRKENVASATQNEFVLANINKIGNRVRVQLANTGERRILNLATVSVFGNPVTSAVAAADVSGADRSQYLLFRPTEILAQTTLPIMPALGSNFGIHFLINMFEAVDERTLLQMDEFGINLLPGGFLNVRYMLEGNVPKTLATKGALAPGRNNLVSVYVYNGINDSNGWKRYFIKADNLYVIAHAEEKRYFVTNPQNKASYAEAVIPLEQFEYIATIPETQENKPFLKIFVNKKLDAERQEEARIVNNTKGLSSYSSLVLFPFHGLIGPLRLSSFYYTNARFVQLLPFEELVLLGNFSIQENKKVAAAKLPVYSRVGSSTAFWLYITTGAALGKFCILRHGSSFQVQLDYVNNALQFKLTVINPTTKEKSPLVLIVPVDYSVIPFRLNHFAVVVDNLKSTVKVYHNGEIATSKRVSGQVVVENHKPIEVGGDCGSSAEVTGVLDGKVLDLQTANYALSKNKIEEMYETKSAKVYEGKEGSIDQINSLFHKMGCPANIIDRQLQGSELAQMYQSTFAQDPKALRANFATLKKMADNVIFNRQYDGNISRESLEVVRLCYGEPTSNVIQRLYKINREIFDLKDKGQVSLPLLSGQVSGLSSTVVGPKMIQTTKLDNLVILFDVFINSYHTLGRKGTGTGVGVGTMESFENAATRPAKVYEKNVLALKFIQKKKHAYVPQIYISPGTNKWHLDVFTTEGIETIAIQKEITVQQTHKISVVFQKGFECNIFVDDELVESRQMMGRIMVSNLFEAIIGEMDGLGGFDGILQNLSVSYNNMYKMDQRTKTLVNPVFALDKPKKLPANLVQDICPNTAGEGGSTNIPDLSFTMHGWLLFKSSNKVIKCNLLQGVLNNTFFKICINEGHSSFNISVGDNQYSLRVPAYFYNQWNYVAFEFDQSGEYTVLSVYMNGNLLETIETNNPVLSGALDGDRSAILLGECKNTFVKQLRLSNYVLTKSQILDFMNNRRAEDKIDSDQMSLFDFEKDIQTLRQELSALKSKRSDVGELADATLKEKCFIIENKWNNFRNKKKTRS